MTAFHTPQLPQSPPMPERFSGTWDHFWSLLEKSEGRVEYQNGEIILDMSYEPDPHSKVANRFGYLLELIFDTSDFEIFNSNRPVYIASDCQCVFNPDASVVQLPKETYTYQLGMTAEMSPLVLVEVLSPSTRDRDFGEKLPCYKQISSARYIVYAELNYPMVYVYKRAAGGEWQKDFYDKLEDQFEINGHPVTLKDIYKRIVFQEFR
jgi:Uma2 family endonuclease